jgi:N-acylglucosamine 2-epimerase
MTIESKINELKEVYKKELYEHVIPFWEKYSVDESHGGFFNNLDIDGKVYDTNKHIWLQGRQVWMFSKLYRLNPEKTHWLEMASSGLKFLRDHALTSSGRVYFCLSKEGKPVKLQRKIFSECFYVMALAEYSRASKEESYLEEAKEGFRRIWNWSSDLTKVGATSYSGIPSSQTLAIPMILLNLIEELAPGDHSEYQSEISRCIDLMKLHVNESDKIVYENVSPEGGFIDSPDGRLLNPGHAIEAGWFLQHWALKFKDDELSKLATDMVRWSFDTGWDKEHGGLYYFLDSKGYDPTPLEWQMKLWWPHCEALYGHLLNYSVTKDKSDFEKFLKVHDYTFKHFPDHKNGEWFGYLDRFGNVTHKFKGGPYKGCFHVPRALLLCLNLLEKLDQN